MSRMGDILADPRLPDVLVANCSRCGRPTVNEWDNWVILKGSGAKLMRTVGQTRLCYSCFCGNDPEPPTDTERRRWNRLFGLFLTRGEIAAILTTERTS